MTEMTGGQAIVRTLIDHGVDTVFGLPGIQLDNIFDALHESRQSVRLIHTRHEQGTAYMALGYAQASGRVGTCLVVPGPGVLNATAALATAAGSNAPVLCLTGQIPSYQIGLGLGIPHELRDQQAALRGVVKWVGRAETPADAPAVMRTAFREMLSGRHQPVAVEMAPDIMGRKADVALLPAEEDYAARELDEQALDRAVAVLREARRPAIFVGSGVFGAEAEMKALAEAMDAPVVMSRTGRGALSDRHPLALGIVEAQMIWDEIDVVLVVGTRFLSPAMSWGRGDEVRTIRIDIDAEQIEKPRPADVALVTSARHGLKLLAERLAARGPVGHFPAERLDEVRRILAGQLAEIEPQYSLAKVLREELPDDAILVVDVTQLSSFIQFGMPFYVPRTLITAGYQGTLGYAGLGAKVACPARKVVIVCGDGGFMFNVQELSTAVAHGIEVVVIVMNDGGFGNVRRIQKASYGGRHIAVDLHNPDFVALAESFGMPGYPAEGAEGLRSALRSALAAAGPALIEVPIGEVPNVWKLVKRPPSQGVVAAACAYGSASSAPARSAAISRRGSPRAAPMSPSSPAARIWRRSPPAASRCTPRRATCTRRCGRATIRQGSASRTRSS